MWQTAWLGLDVWFGMAQKKKETLFGATWFDCTDKSKKRRQWTSIGVAIDKKK